MSDRGLNLLSKTAHKLVGCTVDCRKNAGISLSAATRFVAHHKKHGNRFLFSMLEEEEEEEEEEHGVGRTALVLVKEEEVCDILSARA
jgi:hypothetical protein